MKTNPWKASKSPPSPGRSQHVSEMRLEQGHFVPGQSSKAWHGKPESRTAGLQWFATSLQCETCKKTCKYCLLNIFFIWQWQVCRSYETSAWHQNTTSAVRSTNSLRIETHHFACRVNGVRDQTDRIIRIWFFSCIFCFEVLMTRLLAWIPISSVNAPNTE